LLADQKIDGENLVVGASLCLWRGDYYKQSLPPDLPAHFVVEMFLDINMHPQAGLQWFISCE